MSSSSDSSGRRICQAALTLFARHGFARTSMSDVAREAGISRATLYTRFADKSALAAAMADMLVDDALAAANAAWRATAPLADNLEAMLLAKDLPLFRLLQASPHGAELLAVDAQLTSRQAEILQAGFDALLTKCAREAQREGADFTAIGGVAAFAKFLALAGGGLKHELRSEKSYRHAIRTLCVMAARSVQAPPELREKPRRESGHKKSRERTPPARSV